VRVAAIGASPAAASGNSMVDGRWNLEFADSIFRKIQTRPREYSCWAPLTSTAITLSDAAAAVGRRSLGMAPGANIGDHAADL